MSEKYYSLGTHTKEQWVELHAELIADGNTYESVPTRQVTVEDEKLHSPTRGSYLLTDEEATALKADPRVKFINIDYMKYPETYAPPPDEIYATPPKLINRYSGSVKVYREFQDSNNLNSSHVNRTGYQIWRCMQKLDPWVANGYADNFVADVQLQQLGSGKDVDVIVADDGAGWIGHPEFQNNCTDAPAPADYVGGNLLPGNGTCDLLDLVLDAPYYLDPDYFNANSASRLTTRFDGTTVPVESVARSWWTNSAARSAKFQSFGTVSSLTSSYTRSNCNGSNSSYPPFSVTRHATPCCALTFGRTQGWAYNANKWVLNLYGGYGSGIETGFDLQKLYHMMKPVNPEYGNKNPTLSSNSWGYRANKSPGGTYYYHFRGGSATAYSTESGISWLSHMGTQGDSGRWKSEMKTNSMTTALDELIESGVIFVCAAGNSNQKQTNYGHSDYNNYIATNATDTLEESTFYEFSTEVTGTTNRRGFPQQGGKYTKSDGTIDYKTINIGALDDDFKTSKEAKVGYSDRGEGIDCYLAADGTLAANIYYSPEGNYPSTYPGFTANTGSGSGVAEDTGFGGTSAACPVAAGFISTVLEHNRDWTYKEIKQWIRSLDNQDASNFYTGTESTTVNTSNWTDYESLEGGEPKVLYQANIDRRTRKGKRRIFSRGVQINNANIRIKKNKS